MKELIGKRCTGIGTVGIAKDVEVTGVLMKVNTIIPEKFKKKLPTYNDYYIVDEDNRGVHCSVDPATVKEAPTTLEWLHDKEFDLDKFKDYVNSYKPSDAPDKSLTFLKDMIYGIGISIDDKYAYLNGFKKFSKVVTEILEEK